jgi:hypothetical protein
VCGVLVAGVGSTRAAINDVFLQVADNAPSANPLAFYFATATAAADPTVGRIRLNAATQNTASIIRVSQSNGRLVDVTPWLDVMSGGPTVPLGTVTLMDAINPARFLRWDLNTMTDQGAYWDLGVTFIEGSTPDPFVEGEAVTLGFISGVSAAGSTVPVGSLSPVARDTFLGNIGTTTAAPAAVPLASIDSTSIVYDATAHEMQRAALTGFATSTQNSNATSSAEPIVTYSASANMSAERVTTSSTSITVDIATANQIEFRSAAKTGAISIAANANATLFAGIRDNGSAENDRTNLNFVSGDSNTAVVTDDAGNDELEVTYNYVGSTTNVNLQTLTGAQGVVDISTLRCGGSVTIESVSADYTIAGFTAKTDGFWFWIIDRRQSGTAIGTLLEDSGATTTSLRNEEEVDAILPVAGRALVYYFNTRHRVHAASSLPGRLIKRTARTSSGSGTHTYDPRCKRAVVHIVGGGGGGGGCEGGAVGVGGGAAGGGGAGAYLQLDITSVPTSSAYTVGALGAAGAASGGGNGGNGGDSTFHDGSATRTAPGGSGGGGDTLDSTSHVGGDGGAGGAEPSATGAFIYSSGAPGERGVFFFLESIEQGWSGSGGSGPWGGGGLGRDDAEGAGRNATGFGAGGGGAYTETTTDRAGGAGFEGTIIVEEYS